MKSEKWKVKSGFCSVGWVLCTVPISVLYQHNKQRRESQSARWVSLWLRFTIHGCDEGNLAHQTKPECHLSSTATSETLWPFGGVWMFVLQCCTSTLKTILIYGIPLQIEVTVQYWFCNWSWSVDRLYYSQSHGGLPGASAPSNQVCCGLLGAHAP